MGDLEKTGVVEGCLEVGGPLIEMENRGKQLLAGVQGIQHVQKPRGEWNMAMPSGLCKCYSAFLEHSYSSFKTLPRFPFSSYNK